PPPAFGCAASTGNKGGMRCEQHQDSLGGACGIAADYHSLRAPDMDHLEYIELLLEHGADPNLRLALDCRRPGCASTETRTIFTHQWLYEEGATPFLRAAQSGDLRLLKPLLEHGADPHSATAGNG